MKYIFDITATMKIEYQIGFEKRMQEQYLYLLQLEESVLLKILKRFFRWEQVRLVLVQQL